MELSSGNLLSKVHRSAAAVCGVAGVSGCLATANDVAAGGRTAGRQLVTLAAAMSCALAPTVAERVAWWWWAATACPVQWRRRLAVTGVDVVAGGQAATTLSSMLVARDLAAAVNCARGYRTGGDLAGAQVKREVGAKQGGPMGL